MPIQPNRHTGRLELPNGPPLPRVLFEIYSSNGDSGRAIFPAPAGTFTGPFIGKVTLDDGQSFEARFEYVVSSGEMVVAEWISAWGFVYVNESQAQAK